LTIRDVQADFSYTSSASAFAIPTSGTGTFLFPNTYDTSPLAGYLTELTASDTQLSGNVNTARDLGGGDPLWLVIDWTAAVTSGGSATVDIQFVTQSASSLASPTVIYDFTAIGKATLIAGYRQIAKVPRSSNYAQYVGVQAVVGTAALTAGSAIAFLTKDLDSVVQGYASGFSIK
jgi:hypothetical protein